MSARRVLPFTPRPTRARAEDLLAEQMQRLFPRLPANLQRAYVDLVQYQLGEEDTPPAEHEEALVTVYDDADSLVQNIIDDEKRGAE